MPDDTPRDDDAERLEAERLGRIRVGAAAQRMVRDADQDRRALGMPDDLISVRDAALREARAEIERLTAALADKEREGRCAGWREFGDTLKKRIWDNKKPDFSMKDAVEAINTHHQFEYDRALAARAPESQP